MPKNDLERCTTERSQWMKSGSPRVNERSNLNQLLGNLAAKKRRKARARAPLTTTLLVWDHNAFRESVGVAQRRRSPSRCPAQLAALSRPQVRSASPSAHGPSSIAGMHRRGICLVALVRRVARDYGPVDAAHADVAREVATLPGDGSTDDGDATLGFLRLLPASLALVDAATC